MLPLVNVELKDLFEFTYETGNPRELKKIIEDLLKDADKERLKLLVKIIRAVVR